MGRQTWCTPEQTAFLEAYLPKLDAEKDNNGLTPFYESITAEFIKRWESPTPRKPLPKGVTPKQHADKERGRVSVLGLGSLFHGYMLTTATSANLRLVHKPSQKVCGCPSHNKTLFRSEWEKLAETPSFTTAPSILYLEPSTEGLSVARGGYRLVEMSQRENCY